jgi:biotin transport system substrate-specific component
MFIDSSKRRFLDARHRFHEWKHELDYARKTLLALMFACLTGIGALIRIPNPWLPTVPFTGQVFFVLLSATVLGHIWGGISQTLYVGLGFLGIPWFAKAEGGYEMIFGATTGYLIGFIVAAFLIGWLIEKYPQAKLVHYNFLVMILGILVIYAFGIPILVLNSPLSVTGAILLGGGSFLAVDVLKALLATGSGKLLLTKQPFSQNQV